MSNIRLGGSLLPALNLRVPVYCMTRIDVLHCYMLPFTENGELGWYRSTFKIHLIDMGRLDFEIIEKMSVDLII